MKSLALSATHWTDIKLVAAWISGAMFATGFQLANKIPRPKVSMPMGKRRRDQAGETSWPVEVVSTRRGRK